jgi:hypothetical protein
MRPKAGCPISWQAFAAAPAIWGESRIAPCAIVQTGGAASVRSDAFPAWLKKFPLKIAERKSGRASSA